MEIQPTPELKARFFAQYLGLNVLMRSYFDAPQCLTWPYAEAYEQSCETRLQLKPLSSITDEDAIEITIYSEYSKGKFNEYGYETPQGFQHYSYNSVDFLRSKGYAIPFMGIPVETLIEWGWVKLV